MDAKVTLSFDASVIENAKEYAKDRGISLSRLTEILLRKAAGGNYGSFEEMPVSDWVSKVSEGESEYVKTPKRKDMKDEYFNSRK